MRASGMGGAGVEVAVEVSGLIEAGAGVSVGEGSRAADVAEVVAAGSRTASCVDDRAGWSGVSIGNWVNVGVIFKD